MEFSGANFANGAFSPEPLANKYQNYVDEAIYFTDDEEVVHTFMTMFDNLWVDTVNFKNLANVGPDLLRSYPIYPISPDLNFPPYNDYQDRLVARLKQEPDRIDAVMFRITSGQVPDELIKRVQAGVQVRLITDQAQYRNKAFFWHSYNVDRMYMAGVEVKWKDTATGQDMHQKSIVLHGIQTTAPNDGMAVFGSSNWTAASSDSQHEHNYFTTKPWFIQWFIDQFERKWNNRKAPVDGGGAVTPPLYLPFAPKYPEAPVYVAPADQALGQGSSVTLRWEGGYWAHKYDVELRHHQYRSLRQTASSRIRAGCSHGWRQRNQRVVHRYGTPTRRHLLLAHSRQDDGEHGGARDRSTALPPRAELPFRRRPRR